MRSVLLVIGIKILSKSLAAGAFYNSAERSPPPKCHEDTRSVLLTQISNLVDTSNDLSSSSDRILWLQGPAGAGKTAVAQTLSEIYAQRKRLAGSFFFSRGKGQSGNAQFFVSTVCYQLALSFPEIRYHISSVVAHDPSLLHQSLDVQFQKLITETFQSQKSTSTLAPPENFLIIIDGLDECDSESDQCAIIRQISSLVHTNKVPLTFLVVSRPAPHIRQCFQHDPIVSLVYHEVFLGPSPEEVRVFLSTGFSRIHCENPTMSQVPKPWPTDDVINILVQRSSGYFIYAATVLNFIGRMDEHPVNQLEIVLSGTTSTPFVNLDRLYHHILSSVPQTRQPMLIETLGLISVAKKPLSASDLEYLLCLPTGTTSINASKATPTSIHPQRPLEKSRHCSRFIPRIPL
jgi:hypothetical protein